MAKNLLRASPAPPATSLFADIVFDRPLDVPYTYAVPPSIHSAIGIGKRVLVPLAEATKRRRAFASV
ncbi:MAG: hypothetical protein U0798_16500 [Gemmataceae bacterium]